ncbi:MAG: tetratricopeptide repeat protein [Isosphaeraceae bacterium]
MTTIDELMAAGWRSFEAGDLDGAIGWYGRVLEQQSETAWAWYMLGGIAQLRGRLADAEACYRRAIRLAPDLPDAHNNLAVALQATGRGDEALDSLRRAIVLRPDYAEAYNNLGNVLHDRGALNEAIGAYHRALSLRPDYVEAHHNLGNVLRSAGRTAESIACFDRALALRPDAAMIHLSRAMALLEMQDYRRGWPEYEWRLKCPRWEIPRFDRPMWDGGPLEGRTILLYADHGLGDSIQFIRYAPMVRDRGARVVVSCPGAAARLLATCEGVELVVVDRTPLPEFDVYAPLMSLPGLLGTDAASIPVSVPYLSADPVLVRSWAAALPATDELCIGVAWQGNPTHPRDRFRSFPLERLAPIAARPGVRLYSLQKAHGRQQLAALAGRFLVDDLADSLGDLMDTAAVVSSLDLVIAADTSVAHLAGALGVPVWVALPFAADWRWIPRRDDNPWYPTMRLFRQRDWGDWDDVFARMAAALGEPSD